MSPAALILSASAASIPYPAEAILDAFGDVCNRVQIDGTDLIASAAGWDREAERKGWARIESPSLDPADARSLVRHRAYHTMRALDYDLFAPFLTYGASQMRGSIYGKNVAGRDVYLSIATIDAQNPVMAECRLFDPLGDGIMRNPIGRPEVEHWLGTRVKAIKGPYRSKQYVWDGAGGVRSLHVHFGFKGKPRSKYGAKYDPYALYGMTLVRSEFYEEIIVTGGA